MSESGKTGFERVLNCWDIVVIAIGAMIGWGWVASSGGWIIAGGVGGAAIGFIIGGVMVVFIGLTYAELTSAMPKCGGEHVFSLRAIGPNASFACTWAIILGYIGVICFESCTIPLCISYIFPDFLQGYLYTIAGFDIYITWIIAAVLIAALITYINVRGVKIAAIFQTVMTLIIFIVGIFVIVSGVMMGDVDNMSTQLFAGGDSVSMLRGILAVSMITPFFYIGFDVIPQAAEEINVPLKKIGKIMISSIIIAVLFYTLIIIAIGLLLEPGQIVNSTQGTGLTSVDAILAAYNIPALTNVVIIGGLCGLVTSWNSFVIGSSRAMYAMAESYMIPHIFSKIHAKYHTPVYAILLIGAVSMIAPLFGREMLTWMVDVANMGCCIAYFIVGLSFLLLRKNEPGMNRPYKVRKGKLVGTLAICMSGFMVCMYVIPGTGSTLGWQEWIIAIAWCLLGLMFRTYSRYHYGDKFGHSESYYNLTLTEPDFIV